LKLYLGEGRTHDLKDCISKGCNYIWGKGGLMILTIVSAKVAIIFGGGENSLLLIYLSDDA